jgi:predicted permease
VSGDEHWRRDHQVGPADPKREFDAEIAFHLDELARQGRERGLSPEAARLDALRRFGATESVRAETKMVDRAVSRRRLRIEALRDVLADVRFAGRLFARNPGFTFLATLCIGLGVGVTGAILSAAYSILIRPLPYPRAEELVSVYSGAAKRRLRGVNISYPDYVAWRDGNRTFRQLGIWTWRSMSLTGGTGDAERIEATAVSSEVLPIIGVKPFLGRLFLPEDEVRGGQPVVLLSHSLWKRRYAADSTLVGRSIMIDDVPTVVVGIMPPRFTFPDGQNAWVPFISEVKEYHQNRGYAGAIGRLRPGATVAAAQSDLDRISIALEREFPDDNRDWRADVISLRDDLVGSLRRPLQVFIAAVGCLLLIVTANVANLLLARGFGRRREMAVRTAIGAGRQRLLRQLLIESIALALLGGIVGIAVAAAGIRLLGMTFPDGVPLYLRLELDPVALAITLGVTLTTGILAGLLPAIRTARFDLASAFRDGGTGTAGGSSRGGQLRNGLVVAEIALSVVLLISGGLLMKSFSTLASTDLGFERHGLVVGRVGLPESSYPTETRRLEFFERLSERLAAIPSVSAVGSAQGAPMSGWNVQADIVIEGKPIRNPDNPLEAHYQQISPGYFAALGVPILKGRGLLATDRDTVSPAIVINDILAEREFRGEDPIGKRIRFGLSHIPDPHPKWMTVVGVAKSFRHYRLPEQMGPALYFSHATWVPFQEDFVVRTSAANPSGIIPTLRAAVKEIDPTVPVYRTGTFDQTVARVLWQQRLQSQVVGGFAALALLLATVGIYGVISYNVSQRTRELGIRAAVGATTGDLTRLVVREGGKMAVAGITIGMLAALGFTRILGALLYGVKPTDPLIFAAVPVTLLGVALAASWLPARRAGKADPLVAIRE